MQPSLTFTLLDGTPLTIRPDEIAEVAAIPRGAVVTLRDGNHYAVREAPSRVRNMLRSIGHDTYG